MLHLYLSLFYINSLVINSFSSLYILLQILSNLAKTYHLSDMIFLSILNFCYFQIAQKLSINKLSINKLTSSSSSSSWVWLFYAERWIIFLQHKLWLVAVIDAWGKPPSGILHGRFKWPGEMNECHRIKTDRRSLQPDGTVCEGCPFCDPKDIVCLPLPCPNPGNCIQTNTNFFDVSIFIMSRQYCAP